MHVGLPTLLPPLLAKVSMPRWAKIQLRVEELLQSSKSAPRYRRRSVQGSIPIGSSIFVDLSNDTTSNNNDAVVVDLSKDD